MVEIVNDRPLFKTTGAYVGLQMFFTLFLCQRRVALMIKNAKKMGKKSSLQLLNPAPHSSKLSHNL
jgi:hypothetical protein